MHILTLLRHAKSDRDPKYATDFERPLNERGRRDAPAIGRHLAALELTPDLIVSSPAERARQTAELVARGASYKKPITWQETIYEADVEALFAVIQALPDAAEHVMLVGHNPGFELTASALIGVQAAGYSRGVVLSTATAAHIQLSASRWQDVAPGGGALLWLLGPKQLP